MFRSFTCTTVAVALVLALVLSTVPAQAQPRDLGSRVDALDASWLNAALSWMQSVLGVGNTEPVQSKATAGKKGHLKNPKSSGPTTSSCIDPFGNPVVPCIDIP
ncbi:MAG TPA: hypothetical protein VKM72_16550 [Thermoanaerobaculia bacterium]|nr:hypothetical protein [Thermoanaerobaculia bacterium]